MTQERTMELHKTMPLSEKVGFAAKIIAKGVKDSLPHSAVGFGARALTGHIFKAIDLVPAAGVISVIGTAAYTTSREYSYTRKEDLIGFRKRYVLDFDRRANQLTTEFGEAKTVKGKVWNLFKTAYNESGGRLESLVVSTTLTLGADLGARGLLQLSTMTSEEVRGRYLQACGNDEKQARKLIAKDFARVSLAHRVGSFGEKAEYTAIGMALLKAMRAEKSSDRSEAWKAVKDKRKDKLIRAASVAGIVAIKSVKAFVKFTGGVFIAQELGHFVSFVGKAKDNATFLLHTPTSAEGHFMTLARSASKAAEVPIVSESPSLESLNGQTAMLATDMNFNSGGGYEFVDLRTTVSEPMAASISPVSVAAVALESKVSSLTSLSTVKLNSIDDLVTASAKYSEVSSVLKQTVKSTVGIDGRTNITVGDVLIGMGEKDALRTVEKAGGLLKLASDRDASLSLVSELKQSMMPTYAQFEVGKNGVGALWNALEQGGIDPTKAGSAAEFMDRVYPKLNIADLTTRNAVFKAFSSYDNLNSVSFAQVLNEHDLRGTSGFWNVMNGEVISVKQASGLAVQAGTFDQALNNYIVMESLSGKTAMAGVADFANNKQLLAPNLSPLTDTKVDDTPVYDMVRQPDGRVLPILRSKPNISAPAAVAVAPTTSKVEVTVPAPSVNSVARVDDGPIYEMVRQPDGRVLPVLVSKAKTVVMTEPVVVKAPEPVVIQNPVVVKPPEQVVAPAAPARTGVTYIPGKESEVVAAPQEKIWDEKTYKIGSYDVRSGEFVRLQSAKNSNIFAFENYDGKKVAGGYVDVRFIFDETHGRPEDNSFSWYVNNKGGLVLEAHTGWSKEEANIKGPAEGLRMFGEGGNYRGPQVGYYQLTGVGGKLDQLELLGPQFEIKSLTGFSGGAFRYVDGSYVLNSQINPDGLMGIDYKDIGGGPGTVTVIGCSQSHIEATKDLVEKFESVISLSASKELQDLIKIIKDPLAKDKSVDEAVNKLIEELEKIYKNDSSTMSLLARIKNLWLQKNDNPWSYGRTLWTFQTSN